MQKTIIIIYIATLIFTNCTAKERVSEDIRVLSSDIVDVYDGDTFYVNLADSHHVFCERVGIRPRGFDTPEIRNSNRKLKEIAILAKEFLHQQLEGATVIELMNVRRGKYFRLVADVYVDGQNLADLLIKNKLAYAYDGKKKKTKQEQMEYYFG